MKTIKNIPQDGDRKIKTFFALFPVSVRVNKNKKEYWETRWMQKVTVQYKYVFSWYECWWIVEKFVD